MFSRHPCHYFLYFSMLMLFLGACSSNTDDQPTPTVPVVATPDLALATPQAVVVEGPLGSIPDIPSVLIVSSRQSKTALAAFLKTTPEQLDWVNPRLPDPVSPGTLIVIPSIYRSEGEPLAAIAQKTGLAEEMLRAANPKLGATDTVSAGTVLAMPVLYIVPADTLLSSAVQTLETSKEALLSATPKLANSEEIRAGTVLVVPLESGQQ